MKIVRFSFFPFLILLILLNSCSSNSNQSSIKDDNWLKKDGLKVIAFHGTRQCETCKHMKLYTKSTLEKYFKKELKSEEISFQIIDVDDVKNLEIAEKFEATGTALMLDKVSNGKDKITDISDFAFEFANGDQALFEKELSKLIKKQLVK